MTSTDQSEIPDVSVTMVSKAKEELDDSHGSSSTFNSHASLSQLPTPAQPWNKGMKILLGCKVSDVHVSVWCVTCYVITANPGTTIQ